MSHHVQTSLSAPVLPLVWLSMGLHGHSPWCYTNILYVAEVSYWLTSRVSKTLKCLPDNMRLNKLSKRLLCTTLCANSLDPCTCWWICKILCDCIQMTTYWTLIDLSAGQNNNMNDDISSISWHHCLALNGKLWGYLENLKAQSGLTFKSADFPHLEGIRPTNLKHPWIWTGGSLICETSDH